MKFAQFTIQGLLVSVALIASGAALAHGDHADGHEAGVEVAIGAAIGQPGVAAQVGRSIHIEMTDNMRFTPAYIEVKRGETVRFVIKNTGQVPHELVLGVDKDLQQHKAQMLMSPGMVHEEPGKLSLQPGKQGEVVWQFSKEGVVNFACLVPGHYEAGMKGSIQVSSK
ncbi:cupredoxin family protein [Comamonas aquatilis]|uniref:cupredoxin domain-containing protein n=1 Tax=Comamonas aquatilis TaxID=1778406 RepID=UPI0039EE499C